MCRSKRGVRVSKVVLSAILFLLEPFDTVLARAGTRDSRAPTIEETHGGLRAFSIPDGLDVYISTSDTHLFNDVHLKGTAPLRVGLQPGSYYVGYWMSPSSGPDRLTAIVPQKGLPDLVSTVVHGDLVHSTSAFNFEKDTTFSIEQPNRLSLSPNEQEPYIWDLLDQSDDSSVESNFNRFHYRIRDSRIVGVGAIYKVRVESEGVSHVGIILPGTLLPTIKHFDNLVKIYPKEKRFPVVQDVPEIETLLEDCGIREHRAVITGVAGTGRQSGVWWATVR